MINDDFSILTEKKERNRERRKSTTLGVAAASITNAILCVAAAKRAERKKVKHLFYTYSLKFSRRRCRSEQRIVIRNCERGSMLRIEKTIASRSVRHRSRKWIKKVITLRELIKGLFFRLWNFSQRTQNKNAPESVNLSDFHARYTRALTDGGLLEIIKLLMKSNKRNFQSSVINWLKNSCGTMVTFVCVRLRSPPTAMSRALEQNNILTAMHWTESENH